MVGSYNGFDFLAIENLFGRYFLKIIFFMLKKRYSFVCFEPYMLWV